MIFDLNTTAPGDADGSFDVCIAGAGVAGITLATDLAANGLRVLLLEAGGLDFSDLSQDVYQGDILGRDYFDLDETRLRYLGGTSNHWGGISRPLDSWDFEPHEHIAMSGWPISRDDIDPYLERAAEILEIPNRFPDTTVEASGNRLLRIGFQFSPPVLFGEKYFREMEQSERIALFLNANLVDIRLGEGGDRVARFQCANYADSSIRHSFEASVFVLAMGGIETPRMLLNFRSQVPEGIGNSNDLVGRYFMEHPHLFGGYYVTERKNWPYDKTFDIAPTPEFMAAAGIGNARLIVEEVSGAVPFSLDEAMERIFCSTEVVQDFLHLFSDEWCPATVDAFGRIHVVSEQIPNAASRVTLSDETDRFGLRRGALDWRLTEMDLGTIKELMTQFGVHLAQQRHGNVRLEDWMVDDTEPGSEIGGGNHHMGSTRMASSPQDGVVDENARVFGINNLFVAGSSVFPTSGHANPTLTIVQMTLRLSEHLASLFRS